MRRYIFLALFSTVLWAHQAADPTQQQRDTPTSHPGTENPDTSQRQPAPGKDKAGAKNGSNTGTAQQPGTNNPDIAKRNAPKKTKKQTATSTTAKPK